MTVKIVSAVFHGWRTLAVTVTVSSEEGQGLVVSGLITENIHRDMSRLQYALQNCGMGSRGKKLRIEIHPAVFGNGDDLMLAIATGILVATGKIAHAGCLENFLIVGGLGVTGNAHEIPAGVNICKVAKEMGYKGIVLPNANIAALKIGNAIPLRPVRHLNDLVNFFRKIEIPKTLLVHLNYN